MEVLLTLKPNIKDLDRLKDGMTEDLSLKFEHVQFVPTQPIAMRVEELLEGVQAELAVKIYGDDQNSWDDYPGPSNMGSANFLYIENSTSIGNNYFMMTSGEGARWVYRYNTAAINTQAGFDAHGNTQNDGVVGHELYENNFTGSGRLHDFRGGVGVIFNNDVNRLGTSGCGRIQIREEDCYQSGIDCIYPGIDPITNSYLWSNTLWNTSSGTNCQPPLHSLFEADDTTSGGIKTLANMIEQNRDYWADKVALDIYDSGTPLIYENPSSLFLKDIAANRAGTCSDDDVYWETNTKQLYRCDGVNNWIFVYEPYVYPHPLNTD